MENVSVNAKGTEIVSVTQELDETWKSLYENERYTFFIKFFSENYAHTKFIRETPNFTVTIF